MSWFIEWEPAELYWKNLPPQDQERVATAVHRFVETGQGEWRLLRDEPEAICGRLYIDHYIVVLIIDRSVSTARVEWIYRGKE